MKHLGRIAIRYFPAMLGFAAVFLLLAGVSRAQELGNFGLQYVTEVGLPTEDVRVVVARIIRTALGLLGLVAVLIVLYGGFVWMTAGGDESKITQAKQIITNGVIGLAIITSAFAIASFVIRSLVSATLEGGPGGPGGPGGGPGGGGLPSGAYTVRSISPSGTLTIRNVTVRAVLSGAVSAATVPANFSVTRVSDGGTVAGATTVSGGEIRFEPASPCPAPNEDRFCFDANTEFLVRLGSGIRSTDNRALTCGGFAPACEGRFTTGATVDVSSPDVSITSPEPGQSVSANALVSVFAAASDDAGIFKIDFFADGNPTVAEPGNTAAPVSGSPTAYDGDVLWDTANVSLGAHTLTARAYDVDSNNATSAGVTVMVRAEHCFDSARNFDEVGVDCGGADCGACAGGSCTSASQCASGACAGGVCVDVPRIDAVSPGDGAPGNYVTIAGAFFGVSPGTITFLGDAVTPADDRVAPLAPCGGSWQSNQIIAVIPDGAVSGPIRVERGENADATNDERGPLLDDFVVNTTVRPSVCAISPTSGMPGEGVTISGTQFGEAPGSATIGGRSIEPTWSATQVAGVVPTSAPGTYAAVVSSGGENSNPVSFTVLSETAATTPRIDFLDPATGPPTQYVSIFGANFGSSPGTVRFRLPDGTSALALTNFPAACGENYWRDSVITVKVPLIYGDGAPILRAPHTVVVTRADGAEATAAAPFGINSAPTTPGICAVSPTGGPVGTPVTFSGERFGTTGLVRFWEAADVTPGTWSDQSAQANVPAAATTGPVKVVIGDDVESNGVNFQVGACASEPNSCTDGAECCGDGTCRAQGSCGVAANAGGYVWRFSTGSIPEIPRVAEEQNCVNTNQSPSPWRNSTDACVNATVAATFTVPMDTATLSAGTVIVEMCNSDDAFDADACDAASPLSGVFTVSDNRFVFTPEANLEPMRWYRATLRSSTAAPGASIRSADGRYLDGDNDGEEGGDYVFKFRSRAAAEPCDLDHVEVTPAAATLSARDATRAYHADPTAGNCNALNCAPYNWIWTPGGDVTAATLEGIVTCNATARAVAETLPGSPYVVNAAASSAFVTRADSGELVIDFANPRVIRSWPMCSIACTNATVGVGFNTEMDQGSVLRNMAVYRCVNESCRTFAGDALPLGNVVTVPAAPEQGRGVTEVRATVPLEADAYYRVVLRGRHQTGASEDGAQSMSGAYLTDLNYGDGYSWTFRTRTDPTPCAVERVTVAPSTATLPYVGAVQPYVATAHGGADECDPSGQQLLAASYDWSWELSAVEPPAPALVAAFAPPGAPVNVLPQTGTVGCSSTCLKLGSTAGVSVCGNAVVERGEDCDGGLGCSSDCLHLGTAAPTCGNGIVNAGEDCDDGAVAADDGCGASCLNEGALPDISICGNGDRGDGEDCDDGNKTSGDGCSADCLNEGTGPAPAAGICGDGVLGPAESCDDGNSISGDGCGAACLNEGVGPGAWSRPGASGNCGNGVLQRNAVTRVGEECDDGNGTSDDGCSNRCRLEGSSLRYAGPSLCGDGAVETGEACEFGSPGDGRIDPVQYARASFGGTVTVRGTTEQVSDEATLTVLCACTSDSSCIRPEIPAGYGCGSDRCCSEQPAVQEVVPDAFSTGLCRNTAIAATFSTVMGRGSLVGNVLLAEAAPVAGCQPGKSIAGFPGLCASGKEITVTSEDAADGATVKTTVRLNPISALDAGRTYTVVIRGGSDGVKSARGVAMPAPYTWAFTTGADVCRLNAVNVEPDAWGFTTANNVSADDTFGAAGFDEVADRDKVFTAHAISVRSGAVTEEIVSTSNYSFHWNWSTSDETVVATSTLSGLSDAQVVGSALPKNGAVSLTAHAQVTSGIDAGIVRSADSALRVLLCENPWPARNPTTGQWNPWQDTGGTPTYFELSYCRDRDGDDFPALVGSTGAEAPTIVPTPPGGVLKEFLLRNPQTNDAIGVRVVGNPNHLDPLAWYREQGFTGTPSPLEVHGYAALRDGRTVYVAGANKIGDPIYTNMYLMSVSDNASDDTRRIFEELLASWRFNVNVSDERICSGNGRSCITDSDCDREGPCDGRLAKLRRDVTRLADIREMESALESYSASRKHCSVSTDRFCALNAHCPAGEACVANYPGIESGSFLRSLTNSRWPSWQAALGNDLGIALPADPLNRFGKQCSVSGGGCSKDTDCPTGESCVCGTGNFNADTCFDSVLQTFRCPTGSFTYSYRSIGRTGYTLGTTLEFAPLSEWSPQLPARFGGASPSYSFEVPAACADTTISADALCGNGSLGSAETCELNQTRVMPCADASGRAGTRRDACNGTCSGWVLGSCETGRCGDGVVQAPENCDDGSLNGTYGHCRSDCAGPGPYCGDSITNGGESCDAGSANGQYSPSGNCAWNCLGIGPRCGDGVANGPEPCDGTVQSSVGYCAGSLVPCSSNAHCPAGESCSLCGLSSDGFPQVHTRSCGSSCAAWNLWSGCQPQGGCGNGVREGAEECDDGNTNQNDGCIITNPGASPNTTNNCALPSCGDGYVRLGVEACDDGAGNGVPCTPSYSGVCNYCSSSCAQLTVTGGYCGDNVKNGPEACDGTAGLPFAPGTPCVGGKCPAGAAPAIAYQCYADCSATCPYTYTNLSLSFSRAPALSQFSSTIDVANATVACASTSDCPANHVCSGGRCTDTYINVPPCRLAATSTPLRAGVSFANAAWKPLDVMFLFDISMTTGGIAGSCGTSLQCVKQAVSGPGGAIDQLFDNYPGEVRVGVVKFSLPYPGVTGVGPYAVDVNAGAPSYCSGNEAPCVGDSDCPSGETCLIDPAPLDHLSGEGTRAAIKAKVSALITQGDDDAHLGYQKVQEIFTTYSNSDTEKVLIYVSDGAAVNCPTQAKLEADAAKTAGVKVYTIAFSTNSSYLRSESSECPPGTSAVSYTTPPPSSGGSCTTTSTSSLTVGGCSTTPKYYYVATSASDLDPIYAQIINEILTSDVKVEAASTQNVGEGANQVLNATVFCNPNASQQIPFSVSFGGTGTVGFSNARLSYCP